jgi:hypothetical protein
MGMKDPDIMKETIASGNMDLTTWTDRLEHSGELRVLARD